MAELVIQFDKIIDNIHKISNKLSEHGMEWSLITKVFSGHPDFLKRILTKDVVAKLHSVGDSRLTSLRNIKKINPELVTIYIKPPATIYADEVVEFADISLNSSHRTIRALNQAAKKQNKIHKVIIMIEMGELREGVLRENLIEFYQDVFELPNIKVIGVGSNLGCMYGVEPTFDKLLQLSLYKQLLEAKFNKKLDLISGGSSITLPLLEENKIPPEVNHFRIGEAAFFGTSPLDGNTFADLSSDTFNFFANVIELEEKQTKPDGIIGEGNIGHISELDADDLPETSFRAILDFGLLDVDTDDIATKDKEIKFAGTTSDMTVFDLGKNINQEKKQRYHVGDRVCFMPNYMAVARLLNSKFIDIRFV